MIIYDKSVRETLEQAPEAIRKHLEMIFRNSERELLVEDAVGGKIYVIEETKDFKHMKLANEESLEKLPISKINNLDIEFVEWVGDNHEYLFVVDLINAIGATAYFVPRKFVDTRMKRMFSKFITKDDNENNTEKHD